MLKGQRLRTKQHNLSNEKKRQALSLKIDKVRDEIKKQTKDYLESQDRPHGSKSLVKNAFIVFRSMEGASRLIQAYEASRCWLCCMRCLCDCCVNKSEYRRKLFQGRYLKAEQAVEPSLILWRTSASPKGSDASGSSLARSSPYCCFWPPRS